MSMKTRREVLSVLSERYRQAKTRAEKSAILDETVSLLGCHRKRAIRVLGTSPMPAPAQRKRIRPLAYQAALPVIHRVWEALDYPCAERLHPVLWETACLLASHGHLTLDEAVSSELRAISRATLARRLASFRSPKAKPVVFKRKPLAALRAEVPMLPYA